jgi:hypothetical protein
MVQRERKKNWCLLVYFRQMNETNSGLWYKRNRSGCSGFDFLKHTFSWKLQKGDEVIVPANTYIASVLAILEADLIPVLVEPKLETYNINPDLITEKSTQNQGRSCGSSLRTIGRNGCDT